MFASEHLVSLGFTPDLFPAGIHMCYIYNDDQRRQEVMSKFIDSGLQAGERVGYFTDTLSPRELRTHLADMGVHLPPETDRERLSISAALDTYCPDGIFIPERMLKGLESLYTESLGKGYPGVRVTGEMSWALKEIPGRERLIEYEARVNTILLEYPVTAICQYDARRFDGATLFDVLNVHPMMIVAGQVVHNPYYTPPETFLSQRLADQ